MSQTSSPQSFAETALRLGGKSEEEASRMGAVDKADEQVELLFAPQYQTNSSPVHRAIWDGKVPLELFDPPPLPATAPCDAVMDKSLAIVRRRREEKTLLDDQRKVSVATLEELGSVGYWGLLIDPKYGGSGASFARFAKFLTRMGTIDSLVSALASVHGCIGAVDPVRTFGNAEQKARLLPQLASQKLSAFALTEPAAGSDLTALSTTAELVGDHYEVTGEKLFITNAQPGRLIGLVVKIDKKPAVLIAELPGAENDQFQMVNYGLYALKNAHNKGLKFNRFRVPAENLLVPKVGDGLTIAYHGLNLGRLALCAGAAANLRVFLANTLPWAHYRRTYGQPIDARELVKRRIARMAALMAGCDALVAWGAWLIDQGYRGELEAIIAKIFGSEAAKEGAIELFMKTHGGRSFLHGHLFGDNVHEYLAPCIYEGEGEMLGMAFFKSIVKTHGQTYFEPIGKALQKHGMKDLNPLNPLHLWRLRGELANYGKWSMGRSFLARDRQTIPNLPESLQEHLSFVLDSCQSNAIELSSTMRKHQLKLADRQNRMSEVSSRVQDVIVMLVTLQWAGTQQKEVATQAAWVLCEDIRRKLTGRRPTDHYFREVNRLADMVIAGGFDDLSEVPQAEILMKY